MKRILLMIAFIAFIFSKVNAKVPYDTCQSIKIYSNLLNTITDEFNLGVEYKFHPLQSLRFTFGYYHTLNDDLRDIADNDDKQPLFVYRGPTARIAYLFSMNFNRAGGFYIGPQFVYKYLYYNNMSFSEGSSWASSSIDFDRTEKANILGCDLIMGWEFRTRRDRFFTFGPYIGYCYRLKFRDMKTYNVNDHGYYDYTIKEGHTTQQVDYWLPVFGLNFGMGFKLK